MRRMERQHERRRLDIVELIGRIEYPGGWRNDRLCDAAQSVFGQRHHTATKPLPSTSSDRVNHTADIHTDGERRILRYRHQSAPTPGDVVEVQSRTPHADADLSGTRYRFLHLRNLQHLSGFSVSTHLKRSHSIPRSRAVPLDVEPSPLALTK